MCYQCYGCGKCAGVNPDPNKTVCPFCHTEVPDGTRWCPNCNAYIRPKTGSLVGKRKKHMQATADKHVSESSANSQKTQTPPEPSAE